MSTTPVTPVVKVPTLVTSHTALHVFYGAIIIILGVMAHVWLQEHDARVVAEQTIKVSQQHEKDLEAQISTLSSVAESQKRVIQVQVAAVKTVPQAIAAIPTLSDLPLNARPIPSMPDDVAVNAVALTQELGACRQDRIDLGACQKTIVLKDEIHGEDQKQITALKEKPKFWKRVKGDLRNGSILIGIGALLAKVLL